MVKSQIMCRNGYGLAGHTAPWLNRDIMMLPGGLDSLALWTTHTTDRESYEALSRCQNRQQDNPHGR